MSLKSIKAGFILVFVIGIVFLAVGLYFTYLLFTVELPLGHISKLPLAAVGCTAFGVIMIIKAYPIFIPLKETGNVVKVVCPSCGALVDEAAEVCEKCKQSLESHH